VGGPQGLRLGKEAREEENGWGDPVAEWNVIGVYSTMKLAKEATGDTDPHWANTTPGHWNLYPYHISEHVLDAPAVHQEES
jgi:hypothetical protein